MPNDELLQRLDAYVEYKFREMAVRMNLVAASRLRTRQLAEKLEETRKDLLSALAEQRIPL